MNYNILTSDEIERHHAQGLSFHVFTFGWGQPFQGRCQIIWAPDAERATDAMMAMYGSQWSRQYTEHEWYKVEQALLPLGLLEEPLPDALVVKEVV